MYSSLRNMARQAQRSAEIEREHTFWLWIARDLTTVESNVLMGLLDATHTAPLTYDAFQVAFRGLPDWRAVVNRARPMTSQSATATTTVTTATVRPRDRLILL